jgi:sugar O-acyltransferase (sialic acid O-acetyltransferase NeuD family)
VQRVLILGAGGHGQVVADILLAAQAAGALVTPLGFLDDDPAAWKRTPLGLPVFGALDQLDSCPHDAVVIGIGNDFVRRKMAEALSYSKETFITARHPSAIIGRDVEIGCGTVICAGVVINTGSRIGEHVILNTSSSIDHHNHIGNYVHIAPGTHLGGDVTVGEGTLIGIGATVMPQRRIGAWATVGAGALVTGTVAGGAVVVGVPAKPMTKD